MINDPAIPRAGPPGAWLPDAASLADTALFLAGALLLLWLLRRLPGAPRARAALPLLALTLAFFAVPLLTPATQLPLDYLHRFPPWRSGPEPPAPRAQNPLLTDVVLQVLPFRALARERLLELEPPQWSHEMGTGQPLAGNAQSAPWAPLHLLALALPAERALTVAAAWQVWVSLLLAHLLLRQLGARPAGALFGAVAYGFCAYQVLWLYHPLAMAAAWLPGLLAGLLRLARAHPGGLPLAAVSATGMLTAGHPQTLALALLAAGPLWLLALRRAPAGEAAPRRGAIGRSLLAAVLAAGLAAPALLPLVETLPRSERALHNQRRGGPAAVPFETAMLLPLVQPAALGSPREGNWRGPWNLNEVGSAYAGLLALAVALASALRWRGPPAWALAGGAFLLLAALAVPPFASLVGAIPLLGEATLGRLRLFWCLAVAVAAGLGLERCAEDRRARAVLLPLLGLGALLLAVLGPEDESAWQLAWRLTALLSLLAAAGLLVSRRSRALFPAAAVALLAADLFLLGVRYHPLAPPSMGLEAPGVVRRLQELRTAAGEPFRSSALAGRFLPYLPAVYGLWDPRGYDPMRPGEAAEVLRERLHQPGLEGQILQRPELDQPMLDYLGVRYLLAGAKPLPPPWRRALSDEGGTLWENPRALPLFFVPETAIAADHASGLRFARESPDFARRALVEAAGVSAAPQRGSVRIAAVTANGFELEVRAPAGTVVASSVTWMPGWRARPATVEVLRLNGAFLGLRWSGEVGRVELEYTPEPWRGSRFGAWRLGWLAFALAAVLAVAVAARSRRRSPAS